MGKDNVISQYLAKLGSKGGRVSAQRLTKAERIKRARLAGKAAAAARVAKAKKGGRNASK
jgi:hypothetical protein